MRGRVRKHGLWPWLWPILAIAIWAILAPWFSPWDHAAIDWEGGINQPAKLVMNGHWLGTDDVGRDRLVRLAIGTRITLAVALLAALVSGVIGVAYGALSGWLGGRVDEAMMRAVDALYALPFMFIVILLMVLFGRSILMVFIGIACVEWLTMARIVRGEVLSLKERPFVLAARAAGAPARAQLVGHILPNLAGTALAYLALTLPQLIMVESFLSFLGLGVQEPLTSLGILVKEGADNMDVNPAGLIMPCGLMVILLICMTRLGEVMRDRFQ